MKKCVKVVVSNVHKPETLSSFMKKNVKFGEIEGVVEVVHPDLIEIVLHGPKEFVDNCVDIIESIVIKKSLSQKELIDFSVEPFLKAEDYRGIVRFVKKALTRRV